MTEWPVLASLSAVERDEVLRAGRRRRFAKGEVLMHHGDPADSLHLLDQGRVAVRVLTPDGEQAILNVLGPGAVFGELSLIDGHAHRTATITAMEACWRVRPTSWSWPRAPRWSPRARPPTRSTW